MCGWIILLVVPDSFIKMCFLLYFFPQVPINIASEYKSYVRLCLLLSVVGGHAAVPALSLYPAAEPCVSEGLPDRGGVAQSSHPILLSIRPRDQDDHAEQGAHFCPLMAHNI